MSSRHMRSRYTYLAFVVSLLVAGRAVDAQTPTRPQIDSAASAPAVTDSLSGAWESRSPNPAYGGNLYLRMNLRQMGDSVTGTVVLEYEDRSSEVPIDIAGAVRDGRLKLVGRFGRFQLNGSLISGKLQARISPGRAAESSAFSATFTRVR